jgi:D-alanyl-D-alanine endopeptidase (penicillin-binding protein 7)
MASENRAAAALGRSFPGGISAFVASMNEQAAALGLTQTRFADSTGLSSHNVSSPGDLAKLVQAAYQYPLIREYSTTPGLMLTLPDSGRSLTFNNTNMLVKNSSWQIGLQKTGFINESGQCLVMQTVIGTRPFVIVLLDAWGKYSRIGDANRIKKWLELRVASNQAGAT